MQIGFKKFLGIVLSISVALSFAGCVKRVPVQKTRTVQTINLDLNTNQSTALTQDGITISAQPIHPDNLSQYAALLSKAEYWWYLTDYNGNKLIYNGKYQTRSNVIDFSLLAYPAFEVKITNSTDHVLRFSKSVISVEDDKGNSYNALLKSDLPDYLKQSIRAQFTEQYNVSNYDQLLSQAKNIQLLDNNLVVLPGKTVKAFVAINYGKYSLEDTKKYILSQSKFSLGLYEVPSQVNKAGDTTKTTNFNFVFDVKVKEQVENYTAYEYQSL